MDENGIPDYWRGDVSGLYALENGGEAIKLIELSVAGADHRPITDIARYTIRGPKTGFWFRAIRFADEKVPDPGRFAFCCFPEAYGPGIRSHYIISQDNVVFKKDLGHGKGIDVYPADPPKEGWETLQ